ncbi:MAG: peptidoglycan DD-metalloendopeptidase family protein [Lachnoclostridium sp.]|nr:peptidoglycan DD-metalloendopeptidase family protein [Lachnospira sp.]MCM1247975.1 peptidoglycan DD-metalloendopeptidase family protein [Lachnoclostridium sp.]MCM1535586.1 peptidoglycan DD-metalloendopeptidase family protein [Clostridium sp.]
MRKRRHKRKMNHILIVTSDMADADVKHYRIRPWISRAVVFFLVIVVGALAGYFVYGGSLWASVNTRNQGQSERVQQLEQEKNALEAQIAELNERVQILSNTVNAKEQSEQALAEQLAKQSNPTEFPLTGSASMEEITEGDPLCIFQASAGTMVVATASGTVQSVTDDEEYGHCVRIDHGNGYVTIYRNKGDTTVKQGDSVVQGTTLYIIGEDNTQLGYQMMKDDAYINPMDMLAING